MEQVKAYIGQPTISTLLTSTLWIDSNVSRQLSEVSKPSSPPRLYSRAFAVPPKQRRNVALSIRENFRPSAKIGGADVEGKSIIDEGQDVSQHSLNRLF